MNHIKLTDDDLRVFAYRKGVVATLKPGDKVRVCRRDIESPPDVRGNIGGYTLSTIPLWWSPGDPDDFSLSYDVCYHAPVLHAGDAATVVGILPAVPCLRTDNTRPWVLLLSDAGELGWCYNLEGLSILSYYDSEILAPTGH